MEHFLGAGYAPDFTCGNTDSEQEPRLLVSVFNSSRAKLVDIRIQPWKPEWVTPCRGLQY